MNALAKRIKEDEKKRRDKIINWALIFIIVGISVVVAGGAYAIGNAIANKLNDVPTPFGLDYKYGIGQYHDYNKGCNFVYQGECYDNSNDVWVATLLDGTEKDEKSLCWYLGAYKRMEWLPENNRDHRLTDKWIKYYKNKKVKGNG